MLLEVGRVCVKKYGRDAGSRAVITKILDNGFVNVMTAVRPKERKCNTSHLEFLNEVINVNDKELINKTLGIRPKVVRQEQVQDKKQKK